MFYRHKLLPQLTLLATDSGAWGTRKRTSENGCWLCPPFVQTMIVFICLQLNSEGCTVELAWLTFGMYPWVIPSDGTVALFPYGLWCPVGAGLRFRCLWQDIFQMRWTFTLVDSALSGLATIVWMGLTKSVEGLRKKQTRGPSVKKEFCLQNRA